jgi:hypothetical protein
LQQEWKGVANAALENVGSGIRDARRERERERARRAREKDKQRVVQRARPCARELEREKGVLCCPCCPICPDSARVGMVTGQLEGSLLSISFGKDRKLEYTGFFFFFFVSSFFSFLFAGWVRGRGECFFLYRR